MQPPRALESPERNHSFADFNLFQRSFVLGIEEFLGLQSKWIKLEFKLTCLKIITPLPFISLPYENCAFPKFVPFCRYRTRLTIPAESFSNDFLSARKPDTV